MLRAIGLRVEVVPSGYAEPEDRKAAPPELARRHARAKLEAVRARFADRVVVAADTVVDLDGLALGKPAGPQDAARMLRLLSGREHVVHTAYALGVPGARQPVERLSSTAVRFHTLGDDEIAEYVASGDAMDKAGAYGIQGRAAALVQRVEGDYFTVVGFPLGEFVRDIRRLGFTLPSANIMPTPKLS